jgi:hypothetical protein
MSGVGLTKSTGTAATSGLFYKPQMIDEGDWQRKPKYSEKTCPIATLSTTNPTWPDPGSNPGRRGRKPATNYLSYGAAILYSIHDLQTLLESMIIIFWEMTPCGSYSHRRGNLKSYTVRIVRIYSLALKVIRSKHSGWGEGNVERCSSSYAPMYIWRN